MNNRYSTLASRVYHLDKPIGRSFGDVEYYSERLRGIEGHILEPAVGNGRIFIPLLQEGFQIEGFDTSEEMLSYCREECSKRNLPANVSQQAFENFSYEKSFAAIIIPAGSFQLITDEASAFSVLRRFYDHLAPNGRLIIDLDPIGSILAPTGPIRSWSTQDGGLLTLSDNRVETNFLAQTTLSHSRYEHWRDGSLIATELDMFKLRWWGVNELQMALKSVGFNDVQVSGNYRFEKTPQPDDEIFTFEARRY